MLITPAELGFMEGDVCWLQQLVRALFRYMLGDAGGEGDLPRFKTAVSDQIANSSEHAADAAEFAVRQQHELIAAPTP